MRHFLTLFFAYVALMSFGENYPSRSDALWVTVPDHTDWLYSNGDSAIITVSLYEYGIPAAGREVTFSIGPDMLAADTAGTVTLDSKGQASINIGTMLKPGFRDLRLSANVAGAESRHHIKVGFSPEKLIPFTGEPKDFDSFWEEALKRDAKFPLKYTIEPSARYTTDKMDAYLVRMELPGSWVKAMYGYLFIPKEHGKHPAVLNPPGAGVKTIKNPLNNRYYGENGMIRLETEIHGCHPEMSEEEFALERKRRSDYLSTGLDDPHDYYMLDVYLGCRRWLDFLTQLPEWDGRNLFVQGSSQGGALSIVTAALDPRVKACAANHPALSDMNGYLGDKAGGYPHHWRKNPSEATPEAIRTLEYYDVVNFAKRLKCPVRMSWGFNDVTCPPTTSYEVYNLITAPKEVLLTPINEHWTTATTGQSHFRWLKGFCK